MDDLQTGPIYCCGKGSMVKRCAGEFSSNPGRYYYKCPNGDKHYRSFIWCDQVNRAQESASCSSGMRHYSPSTTTEMVVPNSKAPDGRSYENDGLHKRKNNESQSHVFDQFERGSNELRVVLPNFVPNMFTSMMIILFLACVLLILGFVLGVFHGCH